LITASRDNVDDSRANEALVLLESSGYVDPWKSEIADQINSGSADEINLIIEDLLLNQVDFQSNFRNKDIQRRLDRKC